MHTFFYGWRRKAGVAVLVMALALMGIWFRGYVVVDDISWSFQDEYQLESKGGELHWSRIFYPHRLPSDTANEELWPGEETAPSFWDKVWWQTARYKPSDAVSPHRYLTKYELLGAEISVSDQHRGISADAIEEIRISLWRIPVLLLVSPLTILSTYLILWKSRKRDSGPAQR